MKAYSQDLRQRVVRAVDAGQSQAEIAKTFAVSVATIKRLAMPKSDYGYVLSKDYPAEAKRLEIEGTLKVRLVVDTSGKVTSATQGNGTTSHLTSELFQLMADVKFQHVPYRGSAPMMGDLIAGQISMAFDATPTALPQAQSGAIRAIGRTAGLPWSDKRTVSTTTSISRITTQAIR